MWLQREGERKREFTCFIGYRGGRDLKGDRLLNELSNLSLRLNFFLLSRSYFIFQIVAPLLHPNAPSLLISDSLLLIALPQPLPFPCSYEGVLSISQLHLQCKKFVTRSSCPELSYLIFISVVPPSLSLSASPSSLCFLASLCNPLPPLMLMLMCLFFPFLAV